MQPKFLRLICVGACIETLFAYTKSGKLSTRRMGKASLATVNHLGKKKWWGKNWDLKERCPLALLAEYLTFTEGHGHTEVYCPPRHQTLRWHGRSLGSNVSPTVTDPYGALGCLISVRVEDTCTQLAGTSTYFLKTLTIILSGLVPVLIPGTQPPDWFSRSVIEPVHSNFLWNIFLIKNLCLKIKP